MRKALFVVDLQKDFCEGGAMGVNGANAIVPIINGLMEKGEFDLILASGDFHPKDSLSFAKNQGLDDYSMGVMNGIPEMLWPVHCVDGTDGAEFHKDFNIGDVHLVFRKGENKNLHPFSAFKENDGSGVTDVANILKTNLIDVVYVVGLATDFCVKFTALHAIEEGFKVVMVQDAMVGVTDEGSKASLTEIAEAGGTLLFSADLVD